MQKRLDAIQINGYTLCITTKEIKTMLNDNKLAPFNDEYFNGLSMEDIAQLAKKSIRLTKQHCDDNHKIEELEEKLDIAVKALEEYMTFCRHPAQEALAKIKEIKG